MPTDYFETLEEAEQAQETIERTAMMNQVEVITELEELKKPKGAMRYAVYYEEVEEEEEECPTCNARVAAFMTIGMCDTIRKETGKGPDCDKLERQLNEDKIEPMDVIMKVKPFIKSKEDREVFDQILKEANVTLPVTSKRLPGQEAIAPVTLKDMPQDEETKGMITAVVGLSSWFCSWNEVIDHSRMRDDKKEECDVLFDKVIAGEIAPSQFFKSIMPYIRSDTPEGREKQDWFKDAATVVDFAERGEDVADAIDKLKHRRRESHSDSSETG